MDNKSRTMYILLTYIIYYLSTIVERNLSHNYVNRSLPEQLPDIIPEPKLNLK